jgi:phycocyanin beta chain
MTLDVFSKVVSQADARGEFLSTEQLDALTAVVASGNKRLDAVNRITSNASLGIEVAPPAAEEVQSAEEVRPHVVARCPRQVLFLLKG